MAKMTDEELRALVGSEIRSSLGFLGSELSAQRAESMKRYLAEPYGNEQPDRSQVVSSDVADTIEWILPSLLKIFAAGDDVVAFAPQGPEDEEVAKQATEYCNWIFLRDNPGFLILYTWFKDALIQKNGVVKCWWEENEKRKKERYEGMPEEQFAILLQDVEKGDLEIVAHSEYPDPYAPMVSPDLANVVQGLMLHDVIVQKSEKYGCAKIMPCPPEEFLIAKEATNIQDARFVGHRRRRTISSLIEDGYDREQVEKLGSGGHSLLSSEEALARRTVDDETRPESVTSGVQNPQMREIWVVESYLLVDYDGDGIAERRKIMVAGTGWEILKRDGKPDNEEWDGPVPFAALTPIIMPHRFFGRSVAETIEDLALIKTTLMRQLLDAMYLSTSPRYEVDEDRVTDPAEVMSAKPGGIVRKKGAEPVMTPIMTTPVAAEALSGLEYIDTRLENRTGVTKYNQGLDANSLNKTATGVSQIMSAAQQRIELIARVFAETGVKDLFRLLLNLITKHQNQARIVRLREQWVPMDPREWDSEMDVTINVGLGTGNKEQQALLIQQLLAIDAQIVQLQGGLQGPLLTADGIYKKLERLIVASGIAKNAEGFYTDPKTAPPVPQKPSPEEMKLQLEREKAQIDAQTKITGMELDREETRNKIELMWAEFQAEQALAQQKMQSEIVLKQHETAAQLTMKEADMKQQHQLKRETAMGDMEVKRFMAASSGDPESIKLLGGEVQQAVGGATEEIKQTMAEVNKGLEMLGEAIRQLTERASRPRMIIRDQKTGRAIGVQ